MLPEDSKQRKDDAGSSQQTSLADHFQQNDAQVILYSAKAFEVSAIEWLVHTNQVGPRYFHSQIDLTLGCQPIQAFNHPSFKTMLDMASRATKGVLLPSPKKTRARIIHLFKQRMYLLRDRLNVSNSSFLSFFTLTSIYQGPTVTGQISITCDAWQASNADSYFAVTGHWVKERAPGEWALEHALLGFAQMNCSHSGTHLGQMLFMVLSQLRIVHKVCMLDLIESFCLLTCF
jgi:hypothetical protein